MTTRDNLAGAYQDAGRVAEAIGIYELLLAEGEARELARNTGKLC